MRHQSWCIGSSVALFAVLSLAGCGKTPPAAALGPTPNAPAASFQTFATPDEATAALVAALEQRDTEKLQSLLGPGTEKLLSSGDPVEDNKERDAFLARYRAHNELVAGGPDDLVLMVGDDLWPLPIPLFRKNARWSFDGAAGAEELVLRRIGGNELNTVDVMKGVVEAQDDYAEQSHDGQKPGIYAQKLRSTPGKQDGLYWDVAPDALDSPAGPLLAAASAEGYAEATARGSHDPYHGYFYRMLTAQGEAASGGAQNYLVDGKLTGGFAVLAFPAVYGASGIMTFIVNQDGVVWQRDLGKDTAQAAAAITTFNPDNNWTPLAPES